MPRVVDLVSDSLLVEGAVTASLFVVCPTRGHGVRKFAFTV